jgi:hypothetical protein
VVNVAQLLVLWLVVDLAASLATISTALREHLKDPT